MRAMISDPDTWRGSYDAWKEAAPEPECIDLNPVDPCPGCGCSPGCRCDLDYDRSVDEALTDREED
jgi:hypothetical protein